MKKIIVLIFSFCVYSCFSQNHTAAYGTTEPVRDDTSDWVHRNNKPFFDYFNKQDYSPEYYQYLAKIRIEEMRQKAEKQRVKEQKKAWQKAEKQKAREQKKVWKKLDKRYKKVLREQKKALK